MYPKLKIQYCILYVLILVAAIESNAQLNNGSTIVYTRHILNSSNNLHFKNILHLNFDKDSGIWIIAKGKLMQYKNKQPILFSRVNGGTFKELYRPKYFLRMHDGTLLCQNENSYLKIYPNGEISYYYDKSNSDKQLMTYSSRENMINYLPTIPNYYHSALEARARWLHQPEYLAEEDKIYRVFKKEKVIIGQYKGDIIGEMGFGDTSYLITEHGIIMMGEYSWVKKTEIINASTNETLSHKSVFNIFYCNNRYYLITQQGLFYAQYKNNRLYIHCVIPSPNLIPQKYTSMLTDKNENWFLLGNYNGLIEYTKTGMINLKTGKYNLGSTNSLLSINNKLYSNNKGYWDQAGEFHLDARNKLVAYGDDYEMLHSNEIIISQARQTCITDSNFNLKKIIKRESFYNNLIKDEKGRIFQANKFSISLFQDTSFINLNMKIPNPDDLDIMYSSLAYQDTLYITTYRGILRYKLGNTNPLPILLPDLPIRNLQKASSIPGYFAFTDGAGVFYIHGENVYRVPFDPDNYMKNAHYFVHDKNGRVWIPTNYGMLVAGYEDLLTGIRDSTHQIQYFYYQGTGKVAFTEFNGSSKHSAWYDSTSKRLHFCSTEGIICYYPNQFTTIFPIGKPSIIYTNVDGNKNEGMAIPETDFDNVMIQLGISTIGSKQKYIIEYKFNNETNWYPVNEMYQIFISRKNTGKHKLVVRWRTGIGPNDYSYASWDVYIRPFWYERPVFYIMLAAGILLLIWAYSSWKARKLKEKQKQLEQIISQKTEEISLNLENLRISENQLKYSNVMKEKLINVLAHDIRSPLISTYQIAEYINQNLKKELSHPENNELQIMMNEVSRTILSVYSYANDFLIWYRFHQGNVRPVSTLLNISETLKLTLDMYNPVIKNANNRLVLKLEEEIFVKSDPKLLSVIFRNLIDNANKYSKAETIMIEMIAHDDLLEINFENFAYELTDEIKKYMLRRLDEDFADSEPKEGELLGLRMIAFFSRILSIKLNLLFPDKNRVKLQLFIPYYT